MTLREKLELEIPSKEEDKEVIHLYKVSKFYAAYQYSACLLNILTPNELHPRSYPSRPKKGRKW